MHNVCNIHMPQAICDVVLVPVLVSLQLRPIVSGIGRQHGISLTLEETRIIQRKYDIL